MDEVALVAWEAEGDVVRCEALLETLDGDASAVVEDDGVVCEDSGVVPMAIVVDDGIGRAVVEEDAAAGPGVLDDIAGTTADVDNDDDGSGVVVELVGPPVVAVDDVVGSGVELVVVTTTVQSGPVHPS